MTIVKNQYKRITKFYKLRAMKARKSNYYAYNTLLQPYANDLRHRMTKAEACLWKFAFRNKKMKGYPFRRQRPVLNYIADFMCFELQLIIEVDGITHLLEEVAVKDAIRQKILEDAGFIVIRFDDNEVLSQIDNVIKEIEGVISEIEERKKPPPAPASGG